MEKFTKVLNFFKNILVVLSILLIVNPTLADEKKNKIDKWLDKCLDKNYSTLGSIECYNKAIDMWDAELNRVYKELMKTLKPKGKKLLRASQREWVKFKEKEFEFLNNYPYIYNNKYKHGTITLIVIQDQKLQIVKDRTLELKSFLDFITFKY